MLNSILPKANPFDYLFSNDDAGTGDGGGGSGGDGGSGDGGSGTGQGGTEGAGNGEGGKTLTEAQFNDRMKDRVARAKDATMQEVAKTLGVPIEEAKRLIADAKKREDDEKSDAQKAREAADAEKVEAEQAKAESAKERHTAKVERALIRAIPGSAELDDDALDRKVGRLARLLDLEVGADAEAIAKAVKALKTEEPDLFGVKGGGTPPPHGDPAGTPPKRTGAESAYEKGLKRAKERASAGQYPLLAGQQSGQQ